MNNSNNNLLRIYGMQQSLTGEVSAEDNFRLYYEPVECIECWCANPSDVGYISLDPLTVSSYSRIELDFTPTLILEGGHMGAAYGFDIQVCSYNDQLKWFEASESAVNYVPYQRVTLEHVIEDGYGYWYVDGTLAMTRAIDETTYGYNKFSLFGKNTQTEENGSVSLETIYSSGYSMSGKVFGLKAWDKQGNLFMNCVPCVHNEWRTPGLYDFCGNVNVEYGGMPFFFAINIGMITNDVMVGNEDEYPKNLIQYYASSKVTLHNETDVMIHNFYVYNDVGIGTVIYNTALRKLPDTFINADVTELEASEYMVETNKKAFYQSTNTNFPILPYNIQIIGMYTYQQCTNAVNIPLRDNIVELSKGAFQGCSNLIMSTLPSRLQSIGQYCFDGCTKVSFSSLPSHCAYVNAYAFRNCPNITISSLPDVSADGNSNMVYTYAFQSCTGITSMTFPSSLYMIGNYAFRYCNNLTTVTFLGKLRSPSQNMFADCPNLTDIYVPWSEGEVNYAPWGATNATIHYNYTPPMYGL